MTALAILSSAPLASAEGVSREEFQRLVDRIASLEAQNRQLRATSANLNSMHSAVEKDSKLINQSLLGSNQTYSFEVLDHAENTNTKQRLQLQNIAAGQLQNRVTLGGQITALANMQHANEDSKFGWLMRHPTSSNQLGKSASEAVIHSANLNITAQLSEQFTGYVELLYNPEKNFAADSTITGLPRNNVNVRRAYLLWGDLNHSPYYAAIGKMDIPFGLNDTVSPFTNSTNWHSFAGLAYGALVSVSTDNWHLRAMAVQGGAQFRNANTPVEDSNVPSKLNNFAVDINYQFDLDNSLEWLLGASYQYGSAYCQSYLDTPESAHLETPAATINIAAQGVKHFNACTDNNPAVSAYSRYQEGKLLLIAEYAKTLDPWPGTANPYIAEFAVQENTTFTAGGRYSAAVGLKQPLELSLEFSRFEAGDSGSDWDKQDQLVFGASYFINPGLNLFAELIKVDGWVPLNFLSGGNPGSEVGSSWSSQTSETKILTVGVQAGF